MKIKSERLVKSLVFLLLVLGVQFVGAASNDLYALKPVDHVAYGWVLEGGKANADGTVSVKIMEVPKFEARTYTTAISLADDAHKNFLTGKTRADALASKDGILLKNSFVEIQFNAKNQCIDMEIVEFPEPTYMDSASFGGELTAKGGTAGNMVATGWILAKNEFGNSITIGDGNHLTNVFEETYRLADDVKIYLVDNSTTDGKVQITAGLAPVYNVAGTWNLVKQGGFDDIRVTKRLNGEIYYVQDRWTALCVFDRNYTSSWKDGKARVKELYLFNNALKMGAADLETPDGMQYDGTSWYPYTSKLNEKTWFSFSGSIEPFEAMKNRLYNVGDNYTDIWMFVGDDGTLSLLDQGNRTASYQYWLNIAKLGFDPREVDNIFLTHGHGDHYQALYEGALMIRRAGGKLNTMINPYAQGTKVSNSTASFTLSPTLRDTPVLYSCNYMLTWDKWLDFMGPGISAYIWRSLGHSNDTASFVIKMIAKKGDAFFKEGDVVGWLYFGGYGVKEQAVQGAQRLSLVNSLQYQQSVIIPWAEAQCDFIYGLPQHNNQNSILEVYKASRISGIPFMAGYNEGGPEISNYCENRISIMTYEWMGKAYDNGVDALDRIFADAGLTGYKVAGTRNTVSLDTIEAHGPYKRMDGEYTITVSNVAVIRGFDAFQNKNSHFADQTNVYGFTLDNGFVIPWNSYCHDPDGWYVQVVCKVDDDYAGGITYDTNWNKGNYVTGIKGKETPITTFEGGPIEMANTPENWSEILRTTRFDSKEKAEAYAKTLTNGAYTTPYEGYSVVGTMYSYSDKANHPINDFGSARTGTSSYRVRLDKTSQILLSGSFEETFRKVIK